MTPDDTARAFRSAMAHAATATRNDYMKAV